MGPTSFRVTTWTVREMLNRYSQLRLDPDYQREGSIWSLSKRQLFLDSVINRIDSPKIYLHELMPPEFGGDTMQRYAVIDGRQRLETLKSFAEGDLTLGPGFRLLGSDENESPTEDQDGEWVDTRFSQLTLPGLQNFNQIVARRFFNYPLSVVVVTTDDVTYIEEMFIRLNEGTPLNAAEKRNRGELLRRTVRELEAHRGFTRLSLTNRRGRYNDLVVRFLFFEASGASVDGVPDLRARTLTEFADSFRPKIGAAEEFESGAAAARLLQLQNQVRRVLEDIATTFVPDDHLLKLTGDILTVYVAFRSRPDLASRPGTREQIEEFFRRAIALGGQDEIALSTDELAVLDYFSAVQGTTTGSYLALRASLIVRFLEGNLDIRPPATLSS